MNSESDLISSCRNNFLKYLKDTDTVCVENFYEKLEPENKLIPWPKVGVLKSLNFVSETEKCDPFELEILAEGFKCLAQIYINLLRDFNIFKNFPIRKYSGAYQYISKLNSFQDILNNVGYIEKPYELLYCYNSELTEIVNENNAVETAFSLLICFMEVSELIKLRYHKCEIKNLIQQREKIINENIKKEKYSNLTNDAIFELFKKCEICDGEINLENGVCEMCGNRVDEFSIAPQFKTFITEKFKIDVNIKTRDEQIILNSEIENLNKTEQFNEPDHFKPEQLDETITSNSELPKRWACKVCSCCNNDDILNCEACDTRRE